MTSLILFHSHTYVKILFLKNAPEFTEPEGSRRSMTIVSAFFDMGTFKKGTEEKKRNSSIYIEWSRPYRYMNNPMVIFTDNEHFKQEMLKIRENHLSRTMVVLIPKNLLWSYKLIPWIEKIIRTPGYPEYHPNTVLPEYSSAMFAKTELVAYVAEKNFFNTDYFCWIDIGYYRNILDRRKPFWLEVPNSFDRKRVALTGVYKIDLENTPVRDVFLRKMDWLAGGLQVTTSDVAVRFNKQFQDSLVRYLSMGYVNSDQQVIFSMCTRPERTKYPLDVELQLFYQTPSTKSNIDPGNWFHLGYLMYKENVD
ncbi:hypothetical protein FSP39_022236 [Pinctada imbricata]|uniref:Uncharacterized protein n=1 Tax=Pinctada imbricata TaxID=66713 RepID=A0AA88YFJ6_PINIB|nr:hypothetical protein FSP39_022236 [Pinctada imbricata]